MDIGYGRVSTLDQNPDLQRDALQAAGVEPRRIYLDSMSSALAKRPALDRALEQLRPGDTLVVWRLDRLGRSLRHLIDTVAGLAEQGVGVQEPDRGDRHHHRQREAGLPRLRRPGRVRARPDPRAHRRRAGVRAPTGS
jgi:predicted site-specific integrase-resolvase